jgi:Skp family chaperone for outer membrane proteins
MKNHVLLVVLSASLLNGYVVAAEKKEKEVLKTNLNVADVITNNDIKLEANVRFVETFTVMGEGDSGQIYRKEIEGKRDLAAQTIQDESKKIEKEKNDYIAKSSTMSDAAREKAEKTLLKMERDLKNLVTEKEEELKMDMQIATEKLVQEMEVAVIELAEQENIDVVFDKMTGRAIYVSSEFDFTDKVIKKVNENHQIKVAQNKKRQDTVKVADNTKKAADKNIKS